MVEGGPVPDVPEEVACDNCGSKVGLEDSICLNRTRPAEQLRYRCMPCNRLGVRLTRLGKEQRDLYYKMDFTKTGRQEFYKANKDLFGDDLKAAVTQAYEKSSTEKESDLFSAQSIWLDQKDLETKYANKPDQLANIFKLAKKFEHPTRGVTLYEDVDYIAKLDTLKENETVQTHRQETEDIVKQAKKQKIEKEDKPVKPASSTDKPLSPAQSKKCEKWAAEGGPTKKNMETLAGLIAKAEDATYTGLVPAPYVLAAKTAQLELRGASDLVVACMAEGWIGDFKPVEAAVRDAARGLQTNVDRLQRQIEAADSM